MQQWSGLVPATLCFRGVVCVCARVVVVVCVSACGGVGGSEERWVSVWFVGCGFLLWRLRL